MAEEIVFSFPCLDKLFKIVLLFCRHCKVYYTGLKREKTLSWEARVLNNGRTAYVFTCQNFWTTERQIYLVIFIVAPF
jgi:hypothetical protein